MTWCASELLSASALQQRAIAVQTQIKVTLLEITPDFRWDRQCPCSGNRVIEPAQAVDEVILPLQADSHLQGTVVLPKG